MYMSESTSQSREGSENILEVHSTREGWKAETTPPSSSIKFSIYFITCTIIVTIKWPCNEKQNCVLQNLTPVSTIFLMTQQALVYKK